MQSTQQPLQEMSLKQRLNMVNSLYIFYPRFKDILSAIEYCHHFSYCKDEPECMFLGGQSGVGKTTIYKTYASKYPRQINSEGTTVPILAVTIPAPATVKTVVTKMLWELGDPAYDKGSIGNQTIRLIGLLDNCGVELIILDEFQHFIDRESDKVLRTVSDWLKTLILETNLPIILIGLPESEQVLKLESQSQLSRRFANRCYLYPFSWQEDGGKEFRTFLNLLSSKIPLVETFDLSDEYTARRIYYASDGIVAYVMKLIRYGTYLALQRNQEKLDLSIIATAFEKYVQADKPGKVNPFLFDNFEINSVNKSTVELEIGATNNRIKSKSKKKSASNILRNK
ncbi:transposase [Dulcicalothrix desertica PCC 7102]|uniref:Transposase n=1 Tax=Dulcicalothrix desertica PCC 7102 TaxID=232991 RepID=A0A3S1AJM3_9CYAN|nr:TniB family NTP-binding protein [Dulcicalothrix desertica]RUS93637.1 transposase [Dulcicalothrix desertica PCC 7102]TWH43961.1 TniB protein [Dulcicalothrix desertica PCC 7102]